MKYNVTLRHVLATTVAVLLTYLLTHSMMHSPSWAANWFATSQEIPRISRSPKVHYRTHKRPPPVSILGQPNSVHIPTSHLIEIRPNIIHPSTPRSPHWSLSHRFPQQDLIHPLSSPIRATCPAHLILLDFITHTILGEEYRSFSSSLCNLLHSPVTSSLIGTSISITYSECVFVDLGIQNAINVHAPYCHLWPTRLYNTFLHYLVSGSIFEKKTSYWS